MQDTSQTAEKAQRQLRPVLAHPVVLFKVPHLSSNTEVIELKQTPPDPSVCSTKEETLHPPATKAMAEVAEMSWNNFIESQ